MQTDSSPLDILKENLLGAVDSEYNVTKPDMVLNIISQLETMEITRDQLHATRLGREINNIRQKIDARKKSVQQTGQHPETIIQIAQRAKKLLRSWQGLLTSQPDVTPATAPVMPTPIGARPLSPVPPTPPVTVPVPPSPTINGDSTSPSSSSNEPNKPRLVIKVKINPPAPSNSNNETSQTKRKRDSNINGSTNKRRKGPLEVPITSPVPAAPISPLPLIESSASLPRLKTTQQLLMEMQMNQPDVLSTQTPTVNAILQKQIIDASLHEPSKVDYSALHHGRETSTNTVNPTYPKQISSTTLPNVISPSNSSLSSGSSSKRATLVRRPSSSLIAPNTNWENGSSAGGSPVSPSSSSSSSSITSTTSWPLSTNIPDPPLAVPVIPQRKRRRKHSEHHSNDHQSRTTATTTTNSTSSNGQASSNAIDSLNREQSTSLTPDLANLCSSYQTVADLTDAHRRRILAEHDTRELEARPDLLLVPIDQLAFVYERERTRELNPTLESKPTSLTTVNQLNHPSGLIALPFIDCPLEFDLVLDDLVVQQASIDM